MCVLVLTSPLCWTLFTHWTCSPILVTHSMNALLTPIFISLSSPLWLLCQIESNVTQAVDMDGHPTWKCTFACSSPRFVRLSYEFFKSNFYLAISAEATEVDTITSQEKWVTFTHFLNCKNCRNPLVADYTDLFWFFSFSGISGQLEMDLKECRFVIKWWEQNRVIREW